MKGKNEKVLLTVLSRDNLGRETIDGGRSRSGRVPLSRTLCLLTRDEGDLSRLLEISRKLKLRKGAAKVVLKGASELTQATKLQGRPTAKSRLVVVNGLRNDGRGT